ncbi:hypothetical protein PLICRDRAFT_136372 [Plicaturopsis crispa FD-325 SS-3]|nr:hypothetical protein PLICRDRAFT_136372 [Plicaturopsis crispa FD-325 SS-3]
MDSARPDKRPRTDSEPATEKTRSEPWLFDGTIVLEAQNTQFRVHKSILAASSSVFKDMFEVCRPNSSESAVALGQMDSDALVEGCHVVHMTDAWRDIQHMLRALYERNYHTDPTRTMPFGVVAAFLRLGKKYDIQHIHDEAMLRLTTDYPSTLEAYDSSSRLHRLECTSHAELFAMNLARETQTLQIIPAAMYTFASYRSLRDIMRCADRDSRTIGDSTLAASLSPENSRACLVGREDLMDAQLEHTFSWLAKPPTAGRCGYPVRCMDERRRILAEMMVSPIILTALNEWDEEPSKEGLNLCHSCRAEAQIAHNSGRQAIWDALPSYFGLPRWDALLKA